jgi:hypothetical protein
MINMRFFIFISFVLFSLNGRSQNPINFNTKTLGRIDSLPGNKVSNIWGYTAPNGKEYAIVGSGLATNIIDVSDCANPIIKASVLDTMNTSWREYKVYKNFLYSVSELNGGNNSRYSGLKMFDLSDINNIIYSNATRSINSPNPDTNFFNNGHTLSIDTFTSRLYISGAAPASGKRAVYIYQLSPNNIKPFLLLKIENLNVYFNTTEDLYIHDLVARRDTIFASHTNGGGKFNTYKYDSLTNTLQLLGSNSQIVGLNHSSSPHPLYQNIFYGAIESPNVPMIIYEVNNNGSQILVKGTFKDPLGIPNFTNNIYHNPHAKNNELYVSAYNDGVQIYDISEPLKPLRVAYYDTYPLAPTATSGYTGFNGAWGIYPYFKSGCLVASDINTGFHTFKLDFRKVAVSGHVFLTTEGKGFVLKDTATNNYYKTFINASGNLVTQSIGSTFISPSTVVDSADFSIPIGKNLYLTGLDNQVYKITIDAMGNIGKELSTSIPGEAILVNNEDIVVSKALKNVEMYSVDGQKWKMNVNSTIPNVLSVYKSAF